MLKQSETKTPYTTSHMPDFITPRKRFVFQEFWADSFLPSNRTWVLLCLDIGFPALSK